MTILAILFSLSLYPVDYCQAQPASGIMLQGQFQHAEGYASLKLNATGIKETLVATIAVGNGQFNVVLPPNITKGIYRLTVVSLDQHSHAPLPRPIDFVINGEPNIAISADLAPGGVVTFQNSPENTNWYNYQRLMQQQTAKMQGLNNYLMNNTDKGSTAYLDASNNFDIEKTNAKNIRSAFISNNANAIVGKLIAAKPYRFTNLDTDIMDNKQIHDNLWKSANTADTTLWYTPLYPDLVVDNLRYYMTVASKTNQELRNQNLIEVADLMAKRFVGKPVLGKFLIDKLTYIFLRSGDEMALQHVDQEMRTSESCENDSPATQAELRQRLQAYQLYKKGTPAPNIAIADFITKQNFGLKDIKSENVLLVFWSSGCPHCLIAMPKLNKDILTKKDIKVVAIAAETDPSVYANAIVPFNNMVHHSDFKYWSSPIFQAYFVRGTPTYVLLDKNRNIAAKFNNYETMMNTLK